MDEAKVLAKSLNKAIAGHSFFHEKQVTASMGISEFRHDDDIISLFKRVDKNLYTVKESGRNRVFAE